MAMALSGNNHPDPLGRLMQRNARRRSNRGLGHLGPDRGAGAGIGRNRRAIRPPLRLDLVGRFDPFLD